MLNEEDDGVTIGSPDGVGPRIDVWRVPEAKTVKGRRHLDLRAHYRSGAEELARLLALGARRADVSQAADAS